MRWSWHRRWGFTIVLTHPITHAETRDPYPLRYWTEAGARQEASAFMASTLVMPSHLQGRFSAEVSRLPPPVDVYADRYWRDGEYVGPEI